MSEFGKDTNVSSNDTIYRQAAIRIAEQGQIQGFEWQIKKLLGIPSTQPERKKGQWDFIGWQMFQCSECKHTFTQDFLEGWRAYTYESLFPPFCPNCGAKMEVKRNDAYK